MANFFQGLDLLLCHKKNMIKKYVIIFLNKIRCDTKNSICGTIIANF